jgi:apolipoprotein N-acyltransferase
MEICKDMDFQDTIRADAAKGVRLMGVPAGDFGGDAWLHARMAVMRGVENGFALVRAANEGLVTASDAEGRLIASKMDTPTGLTMIVADLPLGPGPTLYTRIGNAFAWLCVAATLVIGGISRKRFHSPGPQLAAGKSRESVQTANYPRNRSFAPLTSLVALLAPPARGLPVVVTTVVTYGL